MFLSLEPQHRAETLHEVLSSITQPSVSSPHNAFTFSLPCRGKVGQARREPGLILTGNRQARLTGVSCSGLSVSSHSSLRSNKELDGKHHNLVEQEESPEEECAR